MLSTGISITVVPLIVVFSMACRPFEKSSSGSRENSVAGTPAPGSPLRNKLDVNDVSILFPMPKDDSDLQKMIGFANLPTDSARYTLVSESHFSQLKQVAAGQKISMPQDSNHTDYRSWRVVGFRFDPCFPRINNSNPNACSSVELRLVAQPFSSLGGAPTSEDFTAHLVYHVDKQARSTIAKELLRLASASPVSTKGAPLGVHPGLQQQGYGGAFYADVKRFIIKTMNLSNLEQIAFMGLQNNPEPWNFFFSNISGNRVSGANSPVSLSFITPQRIIPTSRFSDSLQKVLDLNLGVSETEMMVTRRIDNPNVHTQASTDCASCHSSTTARLSWEARQQKKLPFGGGNTSYIPAGNDALGGMVTHKLVTGVQDPDPWNVRHFGYFGARPQITDRVLNETTAAAIFLNRNFLK